ncbi:MAG: glycosyltransferase family 4 protein [Phycisphaerae bacterium]|jgi:glycosyltransferase involved in cell wall biosynthesis
MSMRIAVVSEIQLGSHRAHAINVVKTAGGMLRAGHSVVLVCRPPECDPRTPAEILADYGEDRLDVIMQPDEGGPFDPARFGSWATSVATSEGVDCVYARHFHAAIQCAAAAIPTVMETHAHVGDRREEVVKAMRSTQSSRRGIRSIITIGAPLKTWFESLGAAPGCVHIVPDGVDVELFSPPSRPSKPPVAMCRVSGPRITYAGHLYDYKGVPTILEAAALAPELSFVLLGGTPEDLKRVRARAAGLSNVHALGAVPHVEVPAYLWHSDALLLPPSATDPSSSWTSPVKLGEYLASGTPVVASGIRALRRWVKDDHVRWFTPDDASSMVEAVRAALRESPEAAARRAAACAALARTYSYSTRATRILATLDGRACEERGSMDAAA